MYYLDLIALVFVACMALVNRQALPFFYAYLLSEMYFATIDGGFWYSIFTCATYCLFARAAFRCALGLQVSLVVYSFMNLGAAVDFYVAKQVTYFYVIFPYIMKAVDAYVILKLMNMEGGVVNGVYRAPDGYFNLCYLRL